jgi:hypothetical protein
MTFDPVELFITPGTVLQLTPTAVMRSAGRDRPLSFIETSLPFVGPADVRRKAPGTGRTGHDAEIENAYIQPIKLILPFATRLSPRIQPLKERKCSIISPKFSP